MTVEICVNCNGLVINQLTHSCILGITENIRGVHEKLNEISNRLNRLYHPRPDNIDGMKHCLKLIDELRHKYKAMGLDSNDLTLEKVLNDIENEIGIRAFSDWRYRK
jgi:hypothetical protein